MHLNELALATAALCSACGTAPDTSTSATDLENAGEATQASTTFHEAAHGPLPQVTNHGGAIVANPRLITVTFKNYVYASSLLSFAKWLPTAGWLSAWGADYGIQSLTSGGSEVIPQTAPGFDFSNFDAQSYLLSKIADHSLPVPKNGDVLAFYAPGTGCNINGGHQALQYPGVQAEFLILYDCSASTTVDPNQLATMESATSHELAESVTDDYDAWNEDDPLVNIVGGGEIADMCIFFDTTTSGFTFERIYSNKAAAAGKNPCVPVPSNDKIYYNVTTPNRTQTVSKSSSSKTYTFPITGWSTAARAAWNIQALTQGGSSTFDPAATISASQINNGQKVTLSMTVPANTPSGGEAVTCIWSEAIGWRAYCVKLQVN